MLLGKMCISIDWIYRSSYILFAKILLFLMLQINFLTHSGNLFIVCVAKVFFFERNMHLYSVRTQNTQAACFRFSCSVSCTKVWGLPETFMNVFIAVLGSQKPETRKIINKTVFHIFFPKAKIQNKNTLRYLYLLNFLILCIYGRKEWSFERDIGWFILVRSITFRSVRMNFRWKNRRENHQLFRSSFKTGPNQIY